MSANRDAPAKQVRNISVSPDRRTSLCASEHFFAITVLGYLMVVLHIQGIMLPTARLGLIEGLTREICRTLQDKPLRSSWSREGILPAYPNSIYRYNETITSVEPAVTLVGGKTLVETMLATELTLVCPSATLVTVLSTCLQPTAQPTSCHFQSAYGQRG